LQNPQFQERWSLKTYESDEGNERKRNWVVRSGILKTFHCGFHGLYTREFLERISIIRKEGATEEKQVPVNRNFLRLTEEWYMVFSLAMSRRYPAKRAIGRE
jgi:hypothetical protein